MLSRLVRLLQPLMPYGMRLTKIMFIVCISYLVICAACFAVVYLPYWEDIFRYQTFLPVPDCLLKTIEVRGVVIDQNLQPVPNAKVYVHDKGVYCPNRKPIEVTLVADATGKFRGRLKDYPLYLNVADTFEMVVSANGHRTLTYDQITYEFLVREQTIALSREGDRIIEF